jgi:hypothetical protein
MQLLIEKDRKTYQVDADMVAVTDVNGYCLVIVSNTGDGYEVLSAADGEQFLRRVGLLASRFPGIKAPVHTQTIK